MSFEPEIPSGRETTTDERSRGPAQPVANAGENLAATIEHASGLVANLARAGTAESCVGQAYTQGGRTVIPLATVSVTAGFGMGYGAGGGGEGASQGQGSAGGGGGGGRGASRVIAVVEIDEGGVRIKPVLDFTNLALVSLALAGLFLLARGGRGGAARAVTRLIRAH